MKALKRGQFFSLAVQHIYPQSLNRRLPNPRVICNSLLSTSTQAHPTRIIKSTNFVMPESLKSSSHKARVLVFGAGNFGSCLADHLGDSAHDVFMWSRSENVVKYFNQHHRNPEFLKDHVFPDCITAVGPEFPSADVVRDMDVLLFAIPTQGVRWVSRITSPLSVANIHVGRPSSP